MFERRWISTTEARIYEIENARYVDEERYAPYLEWLKAGNSPAPASGDRFITIVGGVPVEDPEKAAVLAAEEYARLHPPPTAEERIAALEAVINDLLLTGGA